MNSGKENKLKDCSGAVALMLVVWVMIILVMIVAEFSYSMRTEINITRNFKEEEEAYQLALAGIEHAKAEIRSVEVLQASFANEDGLLIFDKDVLEPVRSRKLGKSIFEYILNDEDGKLNINTATHKQLKYIFIESGLDSDEAAEIVDSIIDWRDTNDLHMLNGAEEDYYRDLDEPYSSKDGPFDSIKELWLVKGITEEILYGSVDEEEGYSSGVDYLTV